MSRKSALHFFILAFVLGGILPVCASAFAQTIQYGPDPQEQLDVCVPPSSTAGKPAVLLIHGGGWKAGSRSSLAKRCAEFASRGIVAFAVDYRLATQSPETRWPVQFNDAQLAMRWVRANAVAYGINPNRICAEGDSAGGQLAMLLGAVNSIDQGDTAGLLANISPRANCVISISGPTDLVALNKERPGYTNFLMGTNPATILALQTEGSPLLRLQTGMVPTLMIHGLDDPAVPFTQSAWMFETLNRMGTPAWLITHPGGHEFDGVIGQQGERLWSLIGSFVLQNTLPGRPRQLSVVEAVGNGS